MKKNIHKISSHGTGKLQSIASFAAFALTRPGMKVLANALRKKLRSSGIIKEPTVDYHQWILAHERNNAPQPELATKPTFTILLPIHAQEDTAHLDKVITSITAQTYSDWKLNITCTDELKQLLPAYTDPRIHIATDQYHPILSAQLTKDLLNEAGEYIVLMDAHYSLGPHYLYKIAKQLNDTPDAQLIYTDEDLLTEAGRYTVPLFKPGFAPDLLLTHNYIGDVYCMQTSLLQYVLRMYKTAALQGAYDLLFATTTLSNQLHNIPQVLVHKLAATITDTYTDARNRAAKAAIENKLKWGNQKATVEAIPGLPCHYNVYPHSKRTPLVSIIIPTKDQYSLLKTTIDSILQKTDYPNYEIILINNNSTTTQFFELVKAYKAQYANFTCIDAPIPFNFPALINIGAEAAKGEYLLLLNNDMEVRHNNWLTLMVAYAQKEGVGAIGAKLLYPDGTIQHAGIALSAADDGAHLYAHLPAEAAGTQTINNYSAVTGACLLCDKSHFEMVDGMNEDLPVEYNDLDLCLRIQALGFYTVYLPYVTLIHHESATRGHPLRSKASWQQHRHDQAVFAAAWQSLITNDPYYNPNRKLKFTGAAL